MGNAPDHASLGGRVTAWLIGDPGVVSVGIPPSRVIPRAFPAPSPHQYIPERMIGRGNILSLASPLSGYLPGRSTTHIGSLDNN